MKKLLILLTFLMLIPGTLGALNDSLKSYYTFDNYSSGETTLYDELGIVDYNSSVGKAPLLTTSNCKFYYCYYFNGSSTGLKSKNTETNEYTNGTMSAWVKAASGFDGFNVVYDVGYRLVVSVGKFETQTNDGQYHFAIYDGAYEDIDTNISVNANSWVFVSAVWTNSTMKLYLNGTLYGQRSILKVEYANDGRKTGIGGSSNDDGGYQFNGWIDELSIINRTLNSSEIISLMSYNFTTLVNGTPSVPDSPTYSANLSDVEPETENTTTQLNLTLGWANFNITDSKAALFYNGEQYSATLESSSYGMNGTAKYIASLNTAIQHKNNTQYSYYWSYNLTNGTTSQPYNSSGGTQNIFFKYQRLNITRVYNAYTNNTLSIFTANVSLSGNLLSNTTTNGSFVFPLYFGNGNYSVKVLAPNYAYSSSVNLKTLEVVNNSNLSTLYLDFGIYSNNSVYVYVYDEETLNTIESNVSLTLSGAGDYSFNFVNGSLLITNLTDGEYSFLFTADNYTIRVYSVSVADSSFQYLSAYLTQQTQETIFSVLDFDSSAPLENAALTMSKYINNTWTTIESKYSDITGRAQFTYSPTGKYNFYVAKTGYTSKNFTLNPILFDTYTIRLNKASTMNLSNDFSQVYIDYTPKSFINNATNNLTFYFASPGGYLETYGFSIVAPGGADSDSGVNAFGESLAAQVVVNGANIFDLINITIYYDITLGDNRSYVYQFPIYGLTSIGNNTMIDNKGETWGLGILDRVLISTLIILVVAGLTASILGGTAGLVLALMLYGVFVVIGFIPLWLFLLAALPGIVLLMKGGSS